MVFGKAGYRNCWQKREWDFFIGKAEYIKNPAGFIWERVLESAAAADTVLKFEKELIEKHFPPIRNILLKTAMV